MSTSSKSKPPHLRGICFDLAPRPDGLFVPSDEIKMGVWDSFAPVWGPVLKYGVASQFDEVTYGQMLDDAQVRNLCIYMDQDHRSASAGWAMDHVDIPALAYYCSLVVAHEGKIWRSLDLQGHTCSAALPFDPAIHPEGLAGYRCRITPLGKQVLPNYQALSMHFDPFGEDWRGHPVGQVLICVSAVNGPHLPGARPMGGQFSTTRYFDMLTKKRRLFALAKDEGGEGDGAPETKDLSAEMAELAKVLGMPEGSAPESIIGAALAVIKAAQPGEPDADEEPPAMAEELPADDMKYMGDDDKAKGYARKAALRFSAARRAVVVLSKELGTKPSPVAVVKGLLTLKAKSVDSGEYAKVNNRLQALEDERAKEKALARETSIKEILDGAKGEGLISEKKHGELFAQAQKYNASPEDVRSWLPAAEDVTFTAGGAPKGKNPADKPRTDGGGKMVGEETAKAIGAFREKFRQESGGKQLRYVVAQQLYARHLKDGNFDYAAAKQAADRMGADALVKEGK